jgi:hypothetical protein
MQIAELWVQNDIAMAGCQNWVCRWSLQKEELTQRHIQWQASLQKEVDEDSDATVVMKDDAEEDTYSTSDKMHVDSDATVMMKDDAGQNTCSPSGDETKVTRSPLAAFASALEPRTKLLKAYSKEDRNKIWA